MLEIQVGQIALSGIGLAEMSGDIFSKSSHVNNGLQFVVWQTGMGGSNRIARSEVADYWIRGKIRLQQL